MGSMSELPVNDDALSRTEQKALPLYAGRVDVFPKAVKGQVRTIKWIVLVLLLAVYYLGAWIRWDRGPDAPNQALLIDLPNRRAYFFWIEIWPQEVYYFTGILLLGAFGLFLATSIGGRVWCGFTCPQTVWTDLFMWVERLINGDRAAQIRQAKAPWSGGKVFRRGLTHAAWIVISVLTGGAWVIYFNDAPTFVQEFFVGQSSLAVYFFVGLFSLTTYVFAGLAREQVCTYMCPWPRFQSALLDADSLVVTYQKDRGEPRAKHRKGESWEGRGDCIDCRQCVAVCPTGIDIRDGLQLECIGCGLCIDACNTIMDRVERPRGLIRFDTTQNQANRAAGRPESLRIIRPRTIVYVCILLVISGVMLASLELRSSFGVNVLHDRNPLFVRLSDGGIQNGYTVKILNKKREKRSYTLMVEGLEGVTASVVGAGMENGTPILTATPDAVAEYRVLLRQPPLKGVPETQEFDFVLTETASGETIHESNVFRSP